MRYPGSALTITLAAALLVGCTAASPSAAPSDPLPGPASSSATASASAPASTPAPSGAAACLAEAESLSLSARVGQVVMAGVGVDLTSAQRAAITANRLGSVIIMGPTPGGVKKVAALTSQLAGIGGETGMLVSADQEGGLVQRLKGAGFPTMPSAARQARLGDAELAADASRWGKALAKAGVHLNLAPVADVVPARFAPVNEPIAGLGRGYGSDPEVVSAKVAAFSAGMEKAGVAVAVKHFPGLGAVTGNTDFATRVVDSKTTAGSARLRPFRDAVAADVGAVMVSSAYYTRIDADHPAMFSAEVIGVLRQWGYQGVVISDDVAAAAAVRDVPVADRGVRFLRAGGDLLLSVDATAAARMAAGLRKAAKSDPDLAARVSQAAARVLALKASLGLTTCG